MVQRVLDIYQEYRGEWSSVCWISIRNTGVSGPVCAGYLAQCTLTLNSFAYLLWRFGNRN